ncbi:B3 domain-containing protein Os03g0212300-like [Salvia hispanica]|uniref:B3 domain-containing protein Os03g0212300-like n=1 Tax=Salvia hispanica TaxID=49212 RepID=UPI0020098425|nr:B3 domain-containing protein Os03g0212300-like [Salvia hispanica]
MGGGSYYGGNSDDESIDLRKAPSFMKIFDVQRNMETIRIPGEWVSNYGDGVPSHCTLSMPNGVPWSVQMVKENDIFYFKQGWGDFVRGNTIENKDMISFTHIGGGEFHVLRCNFLIGCPSRTDYDASLSRERDDELVLDVGSSEDYSTSDESDDDFDTEVAPSDYPAFRMALTKSHIQQTLVLPMKFWKKHLRMSAIQEDIYFNVDGTTWLMSLKQKHGQIMIRHGWQQFARAYSLVEGMSCFFQLVDADEVHFYVSFGY